MILKQILYLVEKYTTAQQPIEELDFSIIFAYVWDRAWSVIRFVT